MIRTSSPARRQVGDVGLERRVSADVLGDLRAVDVDDALVGGGIHAQHHAFAGPPARHPHRPLVPDPADVVADRLVGEDVVVAGRDRGLEGGLELVGPRLGGGGVVEREAPQSVEADEFAGGSGDGLEHGSSLLIGGQAASSERLEREPLVAADALLGGIGHRRGQQKLLRVRVLRRAGDLGRGTVLDDLALVEHGHVVADVVDDVEIVRDEQVGHPGVLLDLQQKIEHARLSGQVEGADRLVAHDELRVERQRPGDGDALPLPARELVRLAVDRVRRQPHAVQQGHHAPAGRIPGDALHAERLGQDVADVHRGVQRRVRVLEDHLQVAAELAAILAADPGDVVALECDRARGDRRQAQDGPADRRLSRARLADEAERATLADAQRHPVESAMGLGSQLLGLVLHDQVADVENGAAHQMSSRRMVSAAGDSGCCMSAWSRAFSPSSSASLVSAPVAGPLRPSGFSGSLPTSMLAMSVRV